MTLYNHNRSIILNSQHDATKRSGRNAVPNAPSDDDEEKEADPGDKERHLRVFKAGPQSDVHADGVHAWRVAHRVRGSVLRPPFKKRDRVLPGACLALAVGGRGTGAGLPAVGPGAHGPATTRVRRSS